MLTATGTDIDPWARAAAGAANRPAITATARQAKVRIRRGMAQRTSTATDCSIGGAGRTLDCGMSSRAVLSRRCAV